MTDIRRPRIWIALALAGIALLGVPVTDAQETTEQYIPIGQSPGVSGKYSYIGKIVEVDQVAHTITVQSERGTKTIGVIPATRIWLDRSKVKNTNVIASYSDCEVGRLVEVMYDHDNQEIADWIKIESK